METRAHVLTKARQLGRSLPESARSKGAAFVNLLREGFAPPQNVPSEGRAGWTALVINLLMFLLLASALTGGYAGALASAKFLDRATGIARLQAAMLHAELERYRPLSYVLAHDVEVERLLEAPSAAAVGRMNAKLGALNREAHVDVAYVLDVRGTGVATSDPSSLRAGCLPLPDTTAVGCGSPHYLTGDVQQGRSEFFALDHDSGRPGMYFSNAVESQGRRLGQVVTKVELTGIERRWGQDGPITFVTDQNGVIVISSVGAWRFHGFSDLPDQNRAQILGRRGEPAPASSADFRPDRDAEGLVAVSLPGRPKQKYMMATVPLSNLGWSLNVLLPAGAEVRLAKLTAGCILFLSCGLLMTISGVLVRRRGQRALEAAREVAARDELEQRVVSRTSELTHANKRLRSEIEEKKQISKNLSRLQDELVQANKLATLGQITAGVAHELNQPVAAIRIYAETSILLLEREESDLAKANLGLIGDLTGRISLITDELRAFSRRSSGLRAPTDVNGAVEGALLLASHRIGLENVNVTRILGPAGVTIIGEKIRLEQVLVNLIQNALDAMVASPVRELRVVVEEDARQVLIHVDDSGVGLSPETYNSLFMPFVTTKANGLGLGLVISHDIVAEFGGKLTAERLQRGSRFTIALPRSEKRASAEGGKARTPQPMA